MMDIEVHLIYPTHGQLAPVLYSDDWFILYWRSNSPTPWSRVLLEQL